MLTLVWIDTTELRSSFNLTTNGWPELLALARQGAISVALSEVSIREVSRLFKKELQTCADRIASGVADANRKLPEGTRLDDPQELLSRIQGQIDAYPGRLRQQLLDHGITIVSVPEISHEALLDREMEGRKPYSDGGGHRDALIWESLLAEIRLDDELAQVIVITGNTRDFCDSKSHATRLHPDLLREVDETGTLASVEWFADLATAMDAIRSAVKESTLDLATAFDQIPSRRESLGGALVASAESLEGSFVPESLLDDLTDDMNLPRNALMDGTIVRVDADPDSATSWIYDEYEGDTFAISGSIAVKLEIQAFIERSMYTAGLPLKVTEADVDDDVHEVSITRDAEAHFNIIMIAESVESAELDHINLA